MAAVDEFLKLHSEMVRCLVALLAYIAMTVASEGSNHDFVRDWRPSFRLHFHRFCINLTFMKKMQIGAQSGDLRSEDIRDWTFTSSW